MKYLPIFIFIAFSIFIIAILIFSYLEEWTFLESIYYTSGLVTVGDSDLYPKQQVAKIFSIIMMFFGFITISFIVSIIANKILKK